MVGASRRPSRSEGACSSCSTTSSRSSPTARSSSSLGSRPPARRSSSSRAASRCGSRPSTASTSGGLAADEGGALFEDRALALRPGRAWGDAERESARRIATKLDGSPLAIELAAGRAAVLSAVEIEARLEHEIDLLRQSAIDVPARHASLAAALEASLRLLAPAERDALVQCAVFRAGFSATDAEAVLALGDDAPPVLSVLEALRDRCMIAPDETARRFRLLAGVRQHLAREVPDAARLAHARWALARFEAYGAELSGEHGARGADRSVILERAEHEQGEALAAFRWSLAHDGELAARLALALDDVLRITGPFPTRSAVLEDAVPALPHGEPRLAARLRIRARRRAARRGAVRGRDGRSRAGGVDRGAHRRRRARGARGPSAREREPLAGSLGRRARVLRARAACSGRGARDREAVEQPRLDRQRPRGARRGEAALRGRARAWAARGRALRGAACS
ncbi:MAG: hypothetical protein M5U28_01835 [Sandaracinaceae bacterium]|nr:hypothetical protein [Sandaracinaceae bacterium]